MIMLHLHTSTCSLLSPPNFHSFSLLTPLHVPFNSQKPHSTSHGSISWRFNSTQATHGHKLSPLYCTVTEEIVEISEEESEFVEIGYISNVHGLQGEVRVKHNTDFPELRLGKPGKRWLRQQFSGKENVLEVELETGRGKPGDKSWIVKLSGFDDVDQARQLVGSTFLASKSDKPELEEGEFYSSDLVGMRVILQDTGETVGTVVNVFDNGGNDLLQVMLGKSAESPSGITKPEISDSDHLIWIPFVEAIVPVVDLDKGEMQISPPKCLLELNIRSKEKSKKERRQLEWKERKSFQRRLISAKKKLGELDQQHIFHGFRYGEKSQRNFLGEQIVSVNSILLQQALQIVEMPVNGWESRQDLVKEKSSNALKIPEKCLTSITEKKVDAYTKHREAGVRLLSEGKVTTVLVLNNRKQEHYSTDPIDITKSETSTLSVLESLLLDKQTILKAEQGESLTVVLISPAENIEPLEKLFASHDYFNFNSEKVRFLAEERVPVVSSSAAGEEKKKVLMKSAWEILQLPIGSGGSIVALSSNNIVEELIKSGVEYIEFCSINERCLFANPVFLGYVHSCEADVGVLTFEDQKDLENDFHIVLPMKSLKKLVQEADKLPLQAILKSNSHVELVNKEWLDVVPSSPNSYEFYCSLESLLHACSVNMVCSVEVTD